MSNVHLPARLFAIVDVWNALRSNRSYRQGWLDEKVLEHIRTEPELIHKRVNKKLCRDFPNES